MTTCRYHDIMTTSAAQTGFNRQLYTLLIGMNNLYHIIVQVKRMIAVPKL